MVFLFTFKVLNLFLKTGMIGISTFVSQDIGHRTCNSEFVQIPAVPSTFVTDVSNASGHTSSGIDKQLNGHS